MNIRVLITFFVLFFVSLLVEAQPFGLEVKEGKIIYTPDVKGNRILDFSYCGYQLSATAIPDVNNVVFVPRQTGDASAIIQRAIDHVSGLKPDKNGFRGAVLLDKDTFYLDRSLRISVSGVVLRGSDKNATVLVKRGYDRSALLHIEGHDDLLVQESVSVISAYIPLNQLSLEVSNTKNLKVGDKVKVFRPSTKDWIASIGCDIFGGGISALGWKPGDVDLYWDRSITEINGARIWLDAPLTMPLDRNQSEAKVLVYRWSGRVAESGVEHLTLVSDYDKKYPMDEDHCWTGVSIANAENCWVRQVNFKHFAGSAVILQPSSSKITVEDCIATQPVSEIGGMRRNTFFTMGQLTLFQRCYSSEGIHDFAAGFAAPGPNAFVQCVADNANGFSGSVDAWACGLLFDVVDIDGHNLTFKNLGQAKNGAGWNTANSLFWQCTASEIECFSPDKENMNRAYACWAQFSGDGLWAESNNHAQPRSLFYAQLAERMKRDIATQARILPRNTNATSSPTLEQAAEMAREAVVPLLTMKKWIQQAAFAPSVSPTKLLLAQNIKVNQTTLPQRKTNTEMVNGRLVNNGSLMVGSKLDIQWWSGKLKFTSLPNSRPHMTRFVPGREGLGLTDRPDSVIVQMKKSGFMILDHNYGLWYDRRRDDHQRVRRRDGDVWGPFYEQPFARSGEGKAWDGLSKYDLNKPNRWYWQRLKTYADKAEMEGMLLYHQHFFQHNIIEAGAHWVDCPWRSANNINNTGFPEPVNFAGDKRIFLADVFYDITHAGRREAYRNYIRQGLTEFAQNKNVVHLISAEYTGPLHFVEFWLDVIDEWQQETGNDALIALSATKDVQDAILRDEKRAAVVDIIDIRYWHYKNDGTTYEPEGGKSLAPRQQARLERVGKVTFEEAYRAVVEYRMKHPSKAVTYYSQNYPDMAWAVFMAGGSCPVLPVKNQQFLKDAVKMENDGIIYGNYARIGKSGIGIIIFSQSKSEITIAIDPGKYNMWVVNTKTGDMELVHKTLKGGRAYSFQADENKVYWFQVVK